MGFLDLRSGMTADRGEVGWVDATLLDHGPHPSFDLGREVPQQLISHELEADVHCLRNELPCLAVEELKNRPVVEHGSGSAREDELLSGLELAHTVEN